MDNSLSNPTTKYWQSSLQSNSTIKILLVDDAEIDRFSYKRYLQADPEQQYQITEAETLEEGLELWRSQQPDIVLLDINLPDGDGLEFLEAIATEQLINKLPVIMLTGQVDERIAVRAMKLGAADYLVKSDVTEVSLLTCIHQVQENNLIFSQLWRLQQQQAVIASMSLHIRRSVSFEYVANAIVQEIRSFLVADRTIIYRFNPDMSGSIVAESVLPQWEPCLHSQIEDTCFQENLGGEYQKGKIFVANDIYEANLTECHIQLLERYQIRANIVVPILLNGTNALWGLLIVHQCSSSRQWQEEDIQLLHQLSVHLAIALQQAELYEDLQTMNSLLDEKVQERTQKLQLQSQVLEEIHDMVVTTDLDGNILSWNSGAEKATGYNATEVLGQKISFLYENAESLQSELIRLLLSEEKYSTEVVMIAKSGKRIDVSLRLSVVKDEQDQITHLIGCANDISDRKLAELELQQLNQELEAKVEQRTAQLQQISKRLALALKSGEFGCWQWDLVSNTKIWDERMYKLYGMPKQADGSIGYDDWANRLHPEDRTSVERLLQQAISGEAEYDTEFRVIHPDGTVYFIKAYGAVVRDEQGNPQAMIGINYDISDRKQIETALMESEAKFRRLVEGAKDLIWATDTNALFTYLSPQFQTIFGFNPNDWIGKPSNDLVHPEDLDRIIGEQMKAIQLGQKVSYIEFRHRHQDGRYIWVSVNSTPIIDAGGIVIGLQGLLTDISDRKKAEQEILENQRFIQQIADSSPNVLYLYDLQEQLNTYANREILTTLGFSAIEIQTLGASWLPSVIHPDDLQLTLEHFERMKLADDGEIISHEYRFRHVNGEWRYFHSRDLVFSRDSQGQVKLIIGTAQDIRLVGK